MPCTITNPANIDLSDLEPHIQGMYDYFDQKLGFRKPPTMVFDSDPSNQSSVLGKTAYYDPDALEIHIYSDGRHPKDMLRSIAHELIHHQQNMEGRLDVGGYSGPGYYLENDKLRVIEHEAMLEGNKLLREYEDTIKKESKDMSLKEWKNNELNQLLMKKFGILKEEKEITHMCALEVTHKASGLKGHPIQHTLTESGSVTHYTVEFENAIVENIAVENLNVEVQEEHMHKRDDTKQHDEKKKIMSEEELEELSNNKNHTDRHRGNNQDGRLREDEEVVEEAKEELEELSNNKNHTDRHRGNNQDGRLREEELEEGSKPDFLDLDKDGDKEESMEDAAKDAEETNEIRPFKENKLTFNKSLKETVQKALRIAKGK
tara:strand:+ start:3636 stop:4760 length:1125 start_codon:yes stop_codon:yes gene_type:complete